MYVYFVGCNRGPEYEEKRESERDGKRALDELLRPESLWHVCYCGSVAVQARADS